MTTTVMAAHGGDSNAVVYLVVLTINCPKAQGYLVNKNEVLEALLGTPVLRIDLEIEPLYAYPAWVRSRTAMQYTLLENDLQDTTLRTLRDWLEDSSWLRKHTADKLWDMLEDKLESDYPDQFHMADSLTPVRIVLINSELLADGSCLRQSLTPMMEHASFFSMNTLKGVPTRIWGKPLCVACGTEMREAGSAFVCEQCGSIIGREETGDS